MTTTSQNQLSVGETATMSDSPIAGISVITLLQRASKSALFFLGASMILLALFFMTAGWYEMQIDNSGYGCDSQMFPSGSSLRRAGNSTCWPHESTINSNYANSIPKEQLRFIVLGDFGRDGFCCQSDVALEMNRIPNVSFIVSTGDSFYESGVTSITDEQVKTSWKNIYTNLPNLKATPWFSVLGNYCYRGSSQALLDLHSVQPLWNLENRYWEKLVKKDHLKLHLIFLDTSPMIQVYREQSSSEYKTAFADKAGGLASQWPRVEEQLTWLKGVLDSSPMGHTRIVFGHHPIYNSGWSAGEDGGFFLLSHFANAHTRKLIPVLVETNL